MTAKLITYSKLSLRRNISIEGKIGEAFDKSRDMSVGKDRLEPATAPVAREERS